MVNLALQGRRFRLLGLSIYLGSMIVLICVAAEELSQAFISTRSFDLSDLAADSLESSSLVLWAGDWVQVGVTPQATPQKLVVY